jgi:hypothetical protein
MALTVLITVLVRIIPLNSIVPICIFVAGQTCGTYYGDCRGLSTYVIIGIVSSCIVLLSITIRFCIYMCNNNTKPAPSLVAVHTSGHVPVRAYGNNMSTQPPRNAPVHTFREDAPPTYATATSSNTGAPKY